MPLPCHHEERVTGQVEPTVELLRDLDLLHPDVLKDHSIEPPDYRDGLVFRSAVESIRGQFIASSNTGRQGLVKDVLDGLANRGYVAEYEQSSSRARYDFTVMVSRSPEYFVALEVKGGEGNSINISERPLWAREFCVWCHLDGAIVHQPADGAHSIINRLTNELVRRGKQVDALLFKDVLCGTRTRPCPKYEENAEAIGLRAAPDIFLFPQRVPSAEDPEPPTHTLETLRFPGLVLAIFGIEPSERPRHVWEVNVSVARLDDGRLRRVVDVYHQGRKVDSSASRAWRETR
jgi:hypothetical protein